MLIAEPGGDSASLNSGKPLASDGTARSFQPTAHRVATSVEDRRDTRPTRASQPRCAQRLGVHARLRGDRVVAIVSTDPTEAGWYDADVVITRARPRLTDTISMWADGRCQSYGESGWISGGLYRGLVERPRARQRCGARRGARKW